VIRRTPKLSLSQPFTGTSDWPGSGIGSWKRCENSGGKPNRAIAASTVFGPGHGAGDSEGVPGRSLGKTNSLNDQNLSEFIAFQKSSVDSAKSWTLDAATIESSNLDLSVKNRNGLESSTHRTPQEILREIAGLEAESAKVLETVRCLVR
jgi:hypothetical protein